MSKDRQSVSLPVWLFLSSSLSPSISLCFPQCWLHSKVGSLLSPTKDSCWLDQTDILVTQQYQTSARVSFLITITKVAGSAFMVFTVSYAQARTNHGSQGYLEL